MRRQRFNKYFIRNLNISSEVILVEPIKERWGIFAAGSLDKKNLEKVEKLEVVETPMFYAYKVGDWYFPFNLVHKGIVAMSVLSPDDDVEFYLKKGSNAEVGLPYYLLIVKCGELCLAVCGYHEKQIKA